MKDLAIIVPTRGRPSNIEDLIFSLQETHTKSELVIVLDDDDPEGDHYFDLGVRTLVYPREGKGMARPLNRAAWELIDEFANFCFLGDDHRPRTENWDQKFIDELNRLGTGLVYGNDLLQGENLPTAVAMTRDIVEELHGMVPPGLAHLYLDNFWLQLGKDLGAITYLPLVIIEHLHPVAGKAEWDAGYKEVNADDVYNADSKAFWEYIGGEGYQRLLYGLEHK